MTLLSAATLTADWPEFNLTDTLLRAGALLAIYLGFTVAQRFVSRQHLFRAIELQLNLLVLVSLAVLARRTPSPTAPSTPRSGD